MFGPDSLKCFVRNLAAAKDGGPLAELQAAGLKSKLNNRSMSYS